MRRSAAVLVLGVAILAGACSSDDGGGSAANTSIPDPTTTASTTTEPRTVAPDIIPDDESQIDEAYVEGVLEGLASAAAQAFDHTRRAGVVDESAQAILLASGTEPDAVRGINSLSRLARQGFEGYREDPSPVVYTVVEVLVAQRDCIVAEIETDSSGLFIDPPSTSPPPGRTMVELLPATVSQRETGLNPTAWVSDSFPVVAEGDPLPDCDITP